MTDAVEQELDDRMRDKMPEAFAWMLEARQRHDGEPGYVRPPPAPTAVEMDGAKRSKKPTVTTVVQVAPAPGDAEIEGLLGALMIECFQAANKSYQLASNHTVGGLPVEMRDIYIRQAARLTRACAEVSTALMRSRGKGGEQKIVVQHLYPGSQAVGMVNKRE
jgi:hypothetical protein